ncbi:hypothetical protein TrispH2_003950 [Trichoplax sp. H2]|nr:hypothetical protein TrispH2_003950 [Trichoplax sp. H2]|eukprot:RDD43403.1 hypothetical protein TrispH2_003950 [Trichoplax sp. H2]
MLYNSRILSSILRNGRIAGLINGAQRHHSTGAPLAIRSLAAPVHDRQNNLQWVRNLQTTSIRQSGMPQLDVPTFMHQYASFCLCLYILHAIIARKVLPRYLQGQKIRQFAAANATAGTVENSQSVKKGMETMKKILEQ